MYGAQPPGCSFNNQKHDFLVKKKKKVVLKDILLFVLDLLNLNGSFNFLRYTLIVHLKLCVKRRIVSVGFHKALRHTH